MMGFSVGQSSRRLYTCALKRCCFGAFAGIFLSIVHLLLEFLGFLLIYKGKSSEAVFELKGVEEGSVLIVVERVIDLLVPDDSTVGT